MEFFNVNTKEWKKPKDITNKAIENIVGNVPIKVNSNGVIEIDKILTEEEKRLIEAL